MIEYILSYHDNGEYKFSYLSDFTQKKDYHSWVSTPQSLSAVPSFEATVVWVFIREFSRCRVVSHKI